MGNPKNMDWAADRVALLHRRPNTPDSRTRAATPSQAGDRWILYLVQPPEFDWNVHFFAKDSRLAKFIGSLHLFGGMRGIQPPRHTQAVSVYTWNNKVHSSPAAP